MKRTPLKRKSALGAGYDYEAFREGIRFLDGLDCWVRRLLEERQLEHPLDWSASALTCAGELDGHHIGISKNRLKQEFPNGAFFDNGKAHPVLATSDPELITHRGISLAGILEDPRNGVLVCRRHHDMVEGPQLTILRNELPPRVFDFAEEYGLGGWLDRYFPPVGRAA